MTALDLLGNPRAARTPRADFACPTDGGALHWDETGLVCRECGRSWDRSGNIPLFFRGGDPPDEEFLARAETDGWEPALAARVPSDELDPARADWRFLLPLSERFRVLDVGARWGALSAAIAGEVDTVVSATEDLTQARLLEIRARQAGLDNVVPVVASAVYLPVPAGAFDLVILNGVLDRSGELGDRRKRRDAQLVALRTVRRKLAPGGLLWAQAGNRFGRPDVRDPLRGLFGRDRGYTCGLDGYRRLLLDAGFRRVDFYAPIPDFRRPRELLPLGDPTVTDFWVQRSFAGRSARAKLMRWALRLGLLPRLVPAFGIVAQ